MIKQITSAEIPGLFKCKPPKIVLPKLRIKNGSLTSMHEYQALAMLCCCQKPNRIFEIGTFEGATPLVLAMNAPKAQVYTLDLAPDQKPKFAIGNVNEIYVGPHQKYQFSDTAEEKRIHRLLGDSATFDFSPFKGSIDLFFVDGAHTYQYTKSDSKSAFESSSKNGTVVWHDYNPKYWKETVRCIDELAKERDLYHIKDTYLAFWKNRQ